MPWTLLLFFFSTLFLLSFLFDTVRYLVKSFIYLICVFCTGVLGTLVALKNGRNADNHMIFYDIMNSIMFWSGISFERRNIDRLDIDGPYVVIGNHQCALDIYSCGQMWPKKCTVFAKKSLMFFPGFNLSLFICDDIFIDRFNKTEARKSVKMAADRLIQRKEKVFLFPEGTRNEGTELKPFKMGAFVLAKEANCPVIPVVFSRYHNFFSSKELRFDSGKVIVKALEPVHPKDFTSIEDMAVECRRRMMAELDAFDKELLPATNE